METRFSNIESNGTCHIFFFHHVEEIWEPKNAPKKLIKNNLLKHAHIILQACWGFGNNRKQIFSYRSMLLFLRNSRQEEKLWY